MKKIYWRPSSVPRVILVVIAIVSIASMLSVELFKTKIKLPHYTEKMSAAREMKSAINIIRAYRIKNIGPIDTEVDPTGSGMIGLPTSPITSKTGYLRAKQTTINPNWAAVMVHMFKRAGARKGDVIAASFSGSFPAINIAIFTAAKALGLKVIAISTVSASNWGANIPELTWLDMERVLIDNGILSELSAAASLGGEGDTALGMPEESRDMLHAAIERNGVRFLESTNKKQNIDERMAIYREFSEGKRIAAYVNVGGGIRSVGSVRGKRLYQPGLNRNPSPDALRIESVMSRFAREGVPVIHMVLMERLAERYELTKSPQAMPIIGQGTIFVRIGYNLYLTVAMIVILVCTLYIFLRRDIGFRIFGARRIHHAPKHPEPMV
jgi:poly-gamma-glutamate system protein